MVESVGDQAATTSEEVPECVLNDTVRNFEPELEDVFVIIPSGDYQRLIFNGQELREREERHMTDFRQWIKDQGKPELPQGYDDGNRIVLRFLQGMKWDYPKTYDAIIENSEWRISRDAIINGGADKFKEDLELGVLYGYKRDIKMHPVIFINVRRMLDSKITLDRTVDMGDFFLNYVITKACIPGKIESWTCIFDLKGVGATEIPRDRIQGLVKSMNKNYRGRLFRFYATDVTFVVR